MVATIIICAALAVVIVLGALHTRRVMRAGCCGGEEPPKKIRAKAFDPQEYPYEKILEIDGMSCENCVTHVHNALNALDGVSAKVDLGRKQVVVHMAENLPDETLRETVRGAGYTVTQIRPA